MKHSIFSINNAENASRFESPGSVFYIMLCLQEEKAFVIVALLRRLGANIAMEYMPESFSLVVSVHLLLHVWIFAIIMLNCT